MKKNKITQKVDIKSVVRHCLPLLQGYSFQFNKVQIYNRISSSKINDKDKRIMLHNIKTCTRHDVLERYLYNALLKYEGDGVVR